MIGTPLGDDGVEIDARGQQPPPFGTDLMLRARTDLARTNEIRLPEFVTLAEVHAWLVELIRAHPEFRVGIAIEVWPDGRKRAKRGGMFAERGEVTTIEHNSNAEISYL